MLVNVQIFSCRVDFFSKLASLLVYVHQTCTTITCTTHTDNTNHIIHKQDHHTQSRGQRASATFEFLPNLFRGGGPTPPQGKKLHCVRKKSSVCTCCSGHHDIHITTYRKFIRGSSAIICMEIIFKVQSASHQH